MDLLEISQSIRKLRLQQNLTVDQLAKKSGFSKGFISQIESEQTSPSIATLTDILEALATTMAEFFKEEKFMRLHIFPYSRRKDTVAYDMPNQVEESVKKDRLKKLSLLAKDIRYELLSEYIKANENVDVLFEAFDGEYVTGHSPSFIEIKAKYSENLSGKIVNVKLISSDDERIYGEI